MPEAFKILGDRQLEEMLAMLGDRATRDVMKPAVNKALTPVNKEAKRLVKQKTGNLKKSIGKRVKAKKNKVTGKITARRGYSGAAKYAHMLEFGTRHMKAQPFMRPALHNKKSAVEQILREAAWYNLEKQIDKQVNLGLLRRLKTGGLRRVL